MKELQRRIAGELLEHTCHNFRFVDGGTLILYFSESSSVGKSHKRLWIDCAWRLQMDQVIQIGSVDDSKEVLQVLQHVLGRTLKSLRLDELSGDLQIHFSNDLIIETFGYSIESESWEFRHPNGLRLGMGPSFTPFERIEEADS